MYWNPVRLLHRNDYLDSGKSHLIHIRRFVDSFCKNCFAPLNEQAQKALSEAKFDPHFQRAEQLVKEMAELEKMNKIIDREFPEAERETLLVLDATTGKNAVSQAKEFGDVADLTGIIITKLDGTAKGGIAITIADEFDMAIKFVGVGEGIDDLREFVPEEFIGGIFDE